MKEIRITKNVWLYFEPATVLYRQYRNVDNLIYLEKLWNWRTWRWDIFKGDLTEDHKAEA